MANQDLEKLILKLDADLRSYEKALAKAQGVTTTQMRRIEKEVQASATRVEGSIGRITDAFKDFGKGLLAGAGIGGISEIGRTITEAVTQAAKLGALADKLGISSDALQELQLGAVQADMSFEDMDKTLLKFSKTLGEAANGQGDYLKTLRANDQQIKGSFLENLKQLADLVANAKNEQEALLLVTQAMGKGSDGWLEVLKQGSAGIEKLGTEAHASGAIIEESLIKEAQKLDREWAALLNRMGTETKTWAIEVAKTIGGLFANAQKMSEDLKNGDVRGFLFGHEGGLSGWLGDQLLGPETKATTGAPAPTSNEAGKTDRLAAATKIFNPEAAAAAAAKMAEADREAKRAKQELTREIERQFNAFTRNLTQVDEQTAAMQLQAKTIGLSTDEIERQRVVQQLLNDAQREGIAVDSGLTAVIEQKAAAYGHAAQAAEDAQNAQQRLLDQQDAIKDSAKGFFEDLRAGTDPIDAITSALNRLADKLIDLALDDVFNSLFKPGGGASAGGVGAIGDFIASLFHSGGTVGAGGRGRAVSPAAFIGARRMHGGGLAGDEVPAILQRGEMVLPKGFRPGGSGSGINIKFIDNAGVSITPTQKRQGDRRELEFMVDQRIDRRVADPYSPTSSALGARGARNPIKRR